MLSETYTISQIVYRGCDLASQWNAGKRTYMSLVHGLTELGFYNIENQVSMGAEVEEHVSSMYATYNGNRFKLL